jgi:streptomycin 6-kinase
VRRAVVVVAEEERANHALGVHPRMVPAVKQQGEETTATKMLCRAVTPFWHTENGPPKHTTFLK